MHLIYYLKCLSGFEDLRDQNRKAFQLKELESSNIQEFLESFCNKEENTHHKESNSNPTDEEDGLEEEPEELQPDYENEKYINGLSSGDSYFINSGVNSTLNCVK